MTYVFFMIA